MPRTRTFLAVDIGDAIRKQAVSLQKQLGRAVAEGVNWTEPGGMHVTLLFLGEVDDREVVQVCRAVKDVAGREPPFALRVSGVGAFPNARRPKVVWGGITDGADSLQRLQAALEEKMLALGCYRKEDRPYTPHLTLGRVTADEASFALATEIPKLADWDGGTTTVGEVRVYNSELRRDGPEYTVIARSALTGPPT
jgi:2'-5' RNA ligase